VVERGNMLTALHRVESKMGAAGVDGVTVADLRVYLKGQWPEIRESSLSGSYKPKPVRGRDTEDEWKRSAKAWHSYGSRSSDTASSAPDPL
jgi:retron-type reverse transcriptase